MFALKQPASCRERGRADRNRALLVAATGTTFIACLMTATASAEVLLWAANKGDQIIQGQDFADFNGSAPGGVLLTFATTAPNQRVIITFDATCFHTVAEGGVIVNILVDPAGPTGEFSAPPTNGTTNGGVVFCTAGGRVNDAKQASVMASARPSQAGTNTVRVRVTSFSPTTPPQVFLQTTALAVVR